MRRPNSKVVRFVQCVKERNGVRQQRALKCRGYRSRRMTRLGTRSTDFLDLKESDAGHEQKSGHCGAQPRLRDLARNEAAYPDSRD
jgi:hypothetical protein